MRKKPEEFVRGDPAVRKNWIVMVLLYVLFLLWLEPLIDFMLSAVPPDKTLGAIDTFNQKKVYVATIAFGVARCLPVLLFLWLGYHVYHSQKLPPKNIRLPFTVPLITGQAAKMAGMLMMSVALLLLLREIAMLVNAQPV